MYQSVSNFGGEFEKYVEMLFFFAKSVIIAMIVSIYEAQIMGQLRY